MNFASKSEYLYNCLPELISDWRDSSEVPSPGATFMHNGIVDLPSRYSVPETLARLQSILKEKGVAIFALVDHSGEAAKVGLEMRPTQLLIFGSPKAGTSLMVAAPSAAIDLPLKALAWEDAQGKVWLSYNAPEYLQQRHGIPAELLKNIAGPGELLQKAVE
jgi:uncharacterized protein (DUF302 family)